MFDEANPDWIPTCNLGYNLKKADTERFERALKRRRVLNQPSASGTTDVCVPEALHDSALSRQSIKPEPEGDCQTDITMHAIQVLEELSFTEYTVADLRIKVMSNSPYPSAEVLRNSSRAVKFYTGIPDWKVLSALVKFIQPAFPKMPNSHLTVFDHFVMFLMKVLLNLFDEYLACRYSIRRTSLSRTFRRVLDVLCARLSSFLVKWPKWDVLRETLPMSFRRFFKKCCVIIDCSEIFIEQPGDLLARAQVWSHYKHHSTLKFLIGITPQGTNSYISQCAGGRMSDKEIVEKSSLIDHLLPGDLIIADRGFTMDKYEVKIPPFTKGKKQLEKVEVDWSREIF